MQTNKIENVVIVGGGTAGWITAALLVKVLGKSINIRLVESEQIGSVGVGEATIPPIIALNSALGIDEKSFLKATNGTIKLGIEFDNWKEKGDSYMHAFGAVGRNFPFCDFHHIWLKGRQEGLTDDFGRFSLNYIAAKQNKFSVTNHIKGTQLPGTQHAYHFDAGLYAKFLRDFSEKLGVERIEGIIDKVNQHQESGDIASVQLQDGQCVSGDLFVDCSGMRALLIEQTLNTGFEDWSHYLPCDRAIAVPSEAVKPTTPYTKSIAHDCGWQWRIPLQHRMGNGLVYSSKYMDEAQAKQLLLDSLDSKPIAEPKVIPFRTGRRRKAWHKNVVSIGLSSGFLEPLESTSIHLIQTAAIRLLKCFPHQGIHLEEVDEYNRQTQFEIERIRDFIILHYKVNQRNDSEFWRACQCMDIPDSLAHRIELFKKTGKVFRDIDELFTVEAWQQVMIGQGVIPQDYHSVVDGLTSEQISELMDSLKILIDRTVDDMCSHDELLSRL